MKRRDARKLLASLEKAFENTRDRSTPPPYPHEEQEISLPQHVQVELRQLISAGNKIQAVKKVTKLTGAGLRASKDYVDDLARSGRR